MDFNEMSMEIKPRGNYFAIQKEEWHINDPVSACGLYHMIFKYKGAMFFQKKDLINIINENYVKNQKYLYLGWKIGKLESDSRFSIININDRKSLNYLKTADNPYPKKDIFSNDNNVQIIVKREWAEHLRGNGN